VGLIPVVLLSATLRGEKREALLKK
jgi:hypothetical protein